MISREEWENRIEVHPFAGWGVFATEGHGDPVALFASKETAETFAATLEGCDYCVEAVRAEFVAWNDYRDPSDEQMDAAALALGYGKDWEEKRAEVIFKLQLLAAAAS